MNNKYALSFIHKFMGTVDPWSIIRLSCLDDLDVNVINGWYADIELRDLILSIRFPMQKSFTQELLKFVSDNKSNILFGIRDVEAGCLKGIVGLHFLDWVNRKCLLSIFLGAENDRGRGFGYVAASLVLDYAFNALNFERVELTVITINKNAIALYKKLGFVHEATKRKACYINDKQLDVEVFGLLRSEWEIELPNNACRFVGAM